MAERILGKNEVLGSIPSPGSRIAGSANGRPMDSDSINLGPNPSPAATENLSKSWKPPRFARRLNHKGNWA